MLIHDDEIRNQKVKRIQKVCRKETTMNFLGSQNEEDKKRKTISMRRRKEKIPRTSEKFSVKSYSATHTNVEDM
ncbi:CLUMA_CG007141, isoform A [Clunio marinus]|uniref:CLUMA_CG007141, isoform A n=1 Tax=Clunio marinus TaxID=568069 RepID=A0A1J1I074_9DIPT|nr:CLUMA_CG007141, isoform A [Clunio marinus]